MPPYLIFQRKQGTGLVSFDGTVYLIKIGTPNLVALDSNGNEVWSKSISSAQAVTVDANHVYVAGGGASNAPQIHKYDTAGNFVWTYTGGITNALPTGIAVDKNGYTYISIRETGDTVHKVDSNGNFVWSSSEYSTDVNDVAVDANGFVYTASSAGDDVIRKLDSSGNEVWNFDGDSSNTMLCVAVDANGFSYGGDSVFGSPGSSVYKINSLGSQVWKYTGLIDSEQCRDVAVDTDGNVYAVSGNSSPGELHKIDSSGNFVWKNTDATDPLQAVAVDINGFSYIGGTDNTIRKINPTGSEVWNVQYSSGNSIKDIAVLSYPII